MLGEAFLCLLLNKMSSNPQPKKIVILSDGKPGHYNQSLGIMDQLSDDEYQLVEINFRSKWHDNILRIFLSLFPGGKLTDKVIWSILFFSLTEETISKLKNIQSVDLILSTGSSVAAVNLLLGQLLDAKTVTCRPPSPVGTRQFDLAILPRLYWRQPERINVCRTLGVPNRINPERLEHFRPLSQKVSSSQRSKIGLLIGGNSPLHNMSKKVATRWIDFLIQLVKSRKWQVLLSTSRRTPKVIEEYIADIVKDRNDDFPINLFSHQTPSSSQFKFEHILANSDLLLVTEDSFSMVCEACSSGKPVVILEVERTQPNWRYRQWDTIYQELTARQIAEWETDQLTNQVNGIVMAEKPAIKAPCLRDAEIAARSINQLLE
ncbi:hypothetical protein CMK13_04980 [Candidatus Poribacteria bacterium]|nr:hypothetical protein [Candidatus Poribacteria bacterium]OUT64334.1 MAG: hypothetical protein CBB75_04685 [bacterium TMED15]